MHYVRDFLKFQFCDKTQHKNLTINRIYMHQPAIKSALFLRFRRLFFGRFLEGVNA